MPTDNISERGWFRRTLLQLELGALGGLVLWSLAGASVINWRYQPAASEAPSCAPSVAGALSDFTRFQWLCAAGGAVLVTAIGGFARRKPRPISTRP